MEFLKESLGVCLGVFSQENSGDFKTPQKHLMKKSQKEFLQEIQKKQNILFRRISEWSSDLKKKLLGEFKKESLGEFQDDVEKNPEWIPKVMPIHGGTSEIVHTETKKKIIKK